MLSITIQTIHILFLDATERDQISAKLLSVDYLREQFSTRYLQTVYDTVTVGYGQKPIIVDADDLQEDPGRILGRGGSMIFHKGYRHSGDVRI